MNVVICGAGAIGASIAYYLARKGVGATVVERSAVACAASGHSGGFLALDWCRGSPVDALARRSFQLHKDLARELDVDWGYRCLDTLGVLASDSRDFSTYGRVEAPAWLDAEIGVHGQLGTIQTTAQVHPAGFTRTMMDVAVAAGTKIVIGVVEGIALGGGGTRVSGVIVDGETIAADTAVIAMGPWSILACQWLPLPATHGLKGHSFVFRYQPPEPHALFVEFETSRGEVDSPEVFPRTDGTTYVCGARGAAALPVDPAMVQPEEAPSERLLDQVRRFAPALGSSEILEVNACYRPITKDGLPLMGPVPGVSGAYVATGHSVWGILNAPASGEAMAELLVDGVSAIDLTAFDPGRLPILDASEVSNTMP